LFEKLMVTVPEAVEREIAGVRCRVFVPNGPAAAVYLHFHGGGMIIGKPEMSDLGNKRLCDRHALAVVSVDYRLAPEHPFPAGPDDGVAVARWLLEHGEEEFGSARLLTGGESAGGYMAAAVLLRIRDELNAGTRVEGANLVFGVYDWGRSPSQRGLRRHDGPDLLDPEGISFFSDCYLPGRSDDERLPRPSSGHWPPRRE
jgi:acetyl esterase